MTQKKHLNILKSLIVEGKRVIDTEFFPEGCSDCSNLTEVWNILKISLTVQYFSDINGQPVEVSLLSGQVNINQAPLLSNIGTQSANVGELLEFTVSAVDPDDDQLTYSAPNLPDGASFNAENTTFSWTPRYDQAGIYVVRFEVTDGELSDFEDVTITVIQLYEDWDVNGDEAANILDMVLVGQHWDEAGLTGWIREDANEDGTISVLDMIVIGQNWTG